MKKIVKYIKNPREIIVYLMNKNLFFFLPDKLFLKFKYRMIVGKKLDLKNPKTYSEKMQWLKLYDRKDIYTKMVDKHESKNYISNIIGKKYIVPTIGVYNNFDEIDIEKLPNQFVIKCTHDSGGMMICTDKSNFDFKKARKKINKYLKRKYFYLHREWPYKNVKPRIIIEQYIENKNKEPLTEYNLFCFNGEPKIVMACYGDKRFNRYNDYYDENFTKLDMSCIYNTSNSSLPLPDNLNEMKEIARKLSDGIPQLRVDFYICNNQILIGELTFYHWAGFTLFFPKKWDVILGEMIKLPKNNK